MKTKKYDIKKIYPKLIDDEIPQSYVDFIVSRCSVRYMTAEEYQKVNAADFATVYPRMAGKA